MAPQIRFLGGYTLCDAAGDALRLPTRKSWALLAYLALSKGSEIPREVLAALLWPRSSDGQARASLRQELAVLRKVILSAGLPDTGATKESVWFALPSDAVDVGAMAGLIKAGSEDALRQAVRYYEGEFLNGLNVLAHPFEDWVWVERQRLKTLVQGAYLQLLDRDAAGEDTDLAIATASALLAVEPTQEQGHRALMRLYWRTGRRAEALLQFQRCTESLRRELDTHPSHETAALAGQIRADLESPRAKGMQRLNGARANWLVPVPEHCEHQTACVLALWLPGVGSDGRHVCPDDLALAQDQFAERCARMVAALGGAVLFGQGFQVVGLFCESGASEWDCDSVFEAAQSMVSDPVYLANGTALWPGAGIAMGPVLIRPAPQVSNVADVVGVPLQLAATYAQEGDQAEIVVGPEFRDRLKPQLAAVALTPARSGDASPFDPDLAMRGTSLVK